MAKVIVERPRRGLHSARVRKPGRSRVILDDDGEPLRVRQPKRDKLEKTKSLNENLNPLKRYLASNVGRPWNKIYSEISAHLKAGSTVQQHVRDHLEDFVAVRTRMKDGAVMTDLRWRGGACALDQDYRLFYVHPRDGLMKRNAKRKVWSKARKDKAAARRTERAARVRELDAKTQLHLFDGVWWELKLAPSFIGATADVVRDAKLTALSPLALYGRSDLRAVAKRVLSKREKKAFKLT